MNKVGNRRKVRPPPPTVLVEISGEFRYTGHAYQHCGDKGGHAISVAGDGFSAEEEGGVSS